MALSTPVWTSSCKHLIPAHCSTTMVNAFETSMSESPRQRPFDSSSVQGPLPSPIDTIAFAVRDISSPGTNDPNRLKKLLKS